MAGKPQQLVEVLVATMVWSTAVAVCGQGVTVTTSPPAMIENPFYNPSPSPPPAAKSTPAPETTGPALLPPKARVEPYPVASQSIANPFLERQQEEPWQSPRLKNPFSAEDGAGLLMRPLRWGPANRWRQPDPPAPTSAMGAPPRQLRAVESTEELQPLDDPIVLEPTQPDQENMVAARDPNEEGQGGLELPDAVAALPDGGEPPDPNQFSSVRVLQPTWLDAVDENALLAAPDDGMDEIAEQPGAEEIVIREPNPKPQIHWVVPRNDTYDPFEETDQSAQVASHPTSEITEEPASEAAVPEHVVFESIRDAGPVLGSPQGSDSYNPDMLASEEPTAEVEIERTPEIEGSTTPIALDHEPLSNNSVAPLTDARQLAAEADTVAALSDVIRLARQALESDVATDELKSARELAAWAHNRRGELFEETGSGQAALDDFQAAVRLDGKCWLAIHNRAIGLAERHEYDQALRDFATVIELNPGLTVAYRNRGELLTSLGRSQEASEDYTMALAQQPASAELYALRGDAWLRMQDYPRALNDFTTSIQLNPDNAHALTGRGNLFGEVGQYQQAITNFNQALRSDPTSVEALRSLSWLLATCPDDAHRNGERAIAAARQAAHFAQPNDPFVLEALAAASAQVGAFDDAIQYQRRAVTVAPTELAKTAQFRLDLYSQRQPYFSGRPQVVQASFGE